MEVIHLFYDETSARVMCLTGRMSTVLFTRVTL